MQKKSPIPTLSTEATNVDVERRLSSVPAEDPFHLSRGIKSDQEISELRRRKGGKKIAEYHSKQNEVGDAITQLSLIVI
jgi:hypothetical protein